MVGVPCFQRSRQVRSILIAQRRIARHGVETPSHDAGKRIERSDVAAYAFEIAAAGTDDDEVSGKYWSAGTGVRLGCAARRQRVDFPPSAAIGCIDSVQIAVERFDVKNSVAQHESPIHDVTASITTVLTVGARIVSPSQRAACSIHGIDPAKIAHTVKNPVRYQGRRFLAAMRLQGQVPGKPKTRNRGGIDIAERRMICARGVPPCREPIIGAEYQARRQQQDRQHRIFPRGHAEHLTNV